MEYVPTRVVSSLPAGTAFSRYIMAKAMGHGDGMTGLELAKGWRDSPQVAACLEAELTYHTKAGVAPGTTTDATFAAPLAAYGIAGEVLTLLRGASIIGQLEGRMRRVPFRTTVTRETGTGTGGAWVGQGLATPVAATAYDTVTQEAYKAGKIVVLTRDLLTVGNPAAERTVRDTVVAGVAAFLDAQFLTPGVTLSANLRPAAITNGATAVTSTGTTAGAMNADLAGLLAAITTGGAGLVWIMKPLTAFKIASTIGGTAAADIPRSLFGIPLILSTTSPAQITLVDAAQILYSDDGAIELDVSEQAALQMDDAPDNPAVATTVMVSLYQQNLWGVRAMKYLAYLRAQSGSVAYMTVAY
jgi:HK97 family phage major capsid protein